MAFVHHKTGVNHAPRYGIGLRRHVLILGAFNELNVVALRIVDRKTEAVVGAAMDLPGLESLLVEVATKAGDVVGGKGDMIHVVGGFRIGRRAVADPLLAGHKAHCLARFDR